MEEKYIIECLRAFLFEEELPPVPIPLDWEELFRKINSHLLAGFFAYQLKRPGKNIWPVEIVQRLHRVRLLSGMRGETYIRELSRIIKAFQSDAQKIILLKGWSLINSLYNGDASQRISSDIDILIPIESAKVGEKILRGQGYVSDEPWIGFFRQYSINTPFAKSINDSPLVKSIVIELHWGLMHVPYLNNRIDFDGIFKRAVPLEIAGEKILALSLEDHFVYNCAHMLHHRHQFVLARWYELALWIKLNATELNWPVVVERAREWRLSAGIQYACEVIEKLWPGIVPANWAVQAQQLRSGIVEKVIHRYEDAGNPNTRPLVVFATLPLHSKLGYLFKLTFPSSGYMTRHYGSAPMNFWPLLYITRYNRFFGFFKQLFTPRIRQSEKKDR